MAVEAAAKTGFPGIWIHGKSIHVDFMHKSVRHRRTLGLDPTKANLKHAARLRSAAMYALRTGSYNEAEMFPHTRPAERTGQPSKRLGDLCKLYLPLKSVDITPETQSRYEIALRISLSTIGRNRQIDALKPADIQQLRVDLIATRAVSTVNRYLATFAGFLSWCGDNGYCKDLAKHCTRCTKNHKDPGPLSFEKYQLLIENGCLHSIDQASVTLAVYTGLRPGELLALALEDVAPDLSKITVRRSVAQSLTFRVPKTNKERTILLFPLAREVLQVLIEDAQQRKPVDLQVWLNCHESRTDRVRILLSPKAQARRKEVNKFFVPSAWNIKWANLIRRAEIRPRPPYQTRQTYACWNLTARGNLAFIAKQMGHNDYSMLVQVHAYRIESESLSELEHI